ncbi:ABC transporter permease [Arthrobacter russicus]|uniref:Oligopeptide transport system permease protein n=1 Tax=Arthrobacter russicus TaxID=172040 RepID=A0ABU1JBU3_9MICC|nr:ABC transporter permease [Arthrobacter russicus]MDN5666955.1 ABC transporter permease [Renibacterium salmoninarum]MDR6269880.1 oligopeptide transport system permease protein [Arthrobacter russicus]
MLRFLLRRILQVIPVFIGATLLVYAMVFAVPGDPIRALFGERQPSEAVINALRAQYNLDQPFFVQYFLFLKNLVSFNLGTDFTGQAISEILARVFPVTAMLAVMALVFEAVFGIVFGLVAGLRKGKLFDATVLLTSLVVIAIPTFVTGFVLQLVFGLRLAWVPPTVGPNPTFFSLLLPAIVLGLISFAYIVRLTRTTVAENANADYVRTATAKGLSRRRVINVHILRNSMIPVVTFLGADLGNLMGGAIVTEAIFNIPGVGKKLFDSILRGEGPTIVAIVSALVLVFVLANLLVDLLYAWLDPRIRYEK